MTLSPFAEGMLAASRAYSRGDLETMLEWVHPEIEWVPTTVFLDRKTFRGHSGVLEYLGALRDDFDDLHVEASVIADAGDHGVVRWHTTGRGKLSGAPVELDFYSAGWLRDGLLHRMRNFTTEEEALAEAGLGG